MSHHSIAMLLSPHHQPTQPPTLYRFQLNIQNNIAQAPIRRLSGYRFIAATAKRYVNDTLLPSKIVLTMARKTHAHTRSVTHALEKQQKYKMKSNSLKYSTFQPSSH